MNFNKNNGYKKLSAANLLVFTEKANGIISERKRTSDNIFKNEFQQTPVKI